jgi:putative Mg2+ transporter-C (MgtC) family protein
MMDALVRELTAGWPDTTQLLRIAFRLAVAALIGAVIGLQRERAGKPAGLRTHMLVALGAALFVVAALESGMSSSDLSRVIQGLVTGIGFIGAGAILKLEDRRAITGLTSAAGLWLTAALGVTVGLGLWGVALVAVALIWFILAVLPRVEARLDAKQDESDRRDAGAA